MKKEYQIMLRHGEEYIIQTVYGRPFKEDDRLFYYRNDLGNYSNYTLVDIASGLSVVSAKRVKDLSNKFMARLEAYEYAINSKGYKKNVQRFEELKNISL